MLVLFSFAFVALVLLERLEHLSNNEFLVRVLCLIALDMSAKFGDKIQDAIDLFVDAPGLITIRF